MVVMVLLHLPTLIRTVKTIPKKIIWMMPIILLGGALTTGLLAPQTHRIYYDENIYLSIGQNLAHLNRAQTCNAGGEEYGLFHCTQWEYNKQPNGFPYIVSVIFRVFGTSEQAIFFFNNLLLGLSALVVFWLLYLVNGTWQGGLFAVMITLATPQNLHWYNTTAAEPSAAFFAALVLLTAWYYLQAKTSASLTLLTACTAFAIHFRPESLLLLPLVLILTGRQAVTTPKALLANLLLFGFLTLPLWLHIELFHNHPWGSSGAPFSLNHFQPNLAVNGWHYLNNQEFPLLFTLLALCGLAWPNSSLAEWWKKQAIFGLWFLSFWAIFLFFYAGSYHYGADIRYALLSYLPLALLAGIGADKIIQLLLKKTTLQPVTLKTILITLILLSLIPFLPLVRAVTHEAWAARADHRFAQQMVANLPKESIILTQNPNMFQIWGYAASQMSLAQTDPNYINQVLFNHYRGGVYFHYNFWCNVPDPVQNKFCHTILEKYEHQLLTEYREKDFRYALYRLSLKSTRQIP